jgi:hypothetical protein
MQISSMKYMFSTRNLRLEMGNKSTNTKRLTLQPKKHLESVKKIAQLEEECSRLRLLIRKKLPGDLVN